MRKYSQSEVGLFYGILTFCLWGFLPVYFNLLKDVSSFEILINRIIWSVVVLLILLYKSKKFINVKLLLKDKKKVFLMFLIGFFISLNWGIYIYATTHSKILEASLGYFINPLMSMFFGAIFLREKLDLVSKISILIVIIAVLIQIFAFGKLPIISLLLPLTFSFYGLLKKIANAPSLEGIFIETMMIFPIALAFFIYFFLTKQSSFTTFSNASLLMLGGVITVFPLITFNIATRNLKLVTLSFLHYIGPTIGIFLAIFIYGEKLGTSKIVSFILIWLALALSTTNALIKTKKG